jgi:CubicO group peptidase (beta-lactamase class C family)
MLYIILLASINLLNVYIMKKAILFLIIILGTIVNSVSSQSISDLLDGYYAYNRFWGSVLVARNGEIVFQKNYGFANKDNNNPITESSLFNLASVTKVFTATAILKLHEEGKLSIYDEVDKYIPGFINDNTDSLTIINLLNHTSGMSANLAQTDNLSKHGNMVVPDSGIVTTDQLISKFRDTNLKSRPGKRFNYNNYGYLLLGYIIEKVTGMDYLDYLNKEIFPAAGMTNTYGQRFLPVQPVTGYTGIGTTSIMPVKEETFPGWLKGAVGLYSSVSDLNMFLQAILNNRLLDHETLNLMLDTCVVTDRGNTLWTAGWEKNEVDGLNLYTHGGSIKGFSTRIGFVPEKNITVVILSNLVKDKSHDGMSSVNYSWVDEITKDIVRIMNGKNVSSLPVPSEKPGRIKNGKYSLDDAHFINISYHKDTLLLETESPGNFTLFDYNLYREITDMSPEYKVCKTFASYITGGDLKDFEKYADEKMKIIFNEKGNAETMNFWNNVVSQAGKCSSTNIYNKDEQNGSKNYSMAFHLEKAELLMQLSFNDNSLINGFFILKIFPKCNIHSVELIPTGKNEYFVDGYSYGGYKDFRVRYDKPAKKISFESGDEVFTASSYK